MHQRWCAYNRMDSENSPDTNEIEACLQKDGTAAPMELGDGKIAPGKENNLSQRPSNKHTCGHNSHKLPHKTFISHRMLCPHNTKPITRLQGGAIVHD